MFAISFTSILFVTFIDIDDNDEETLNKLLKVHKLNVHLMRWDTLFINTNTNIPSNKVFVRRDNEALASTAAPTPSNTETKTTITTKTTSAKSKGKK